MKTHKHFLLTGLMVAGLFSNSQAAPKKPFIKEGTWRGVFSLNESNVPFNFELKGKDAEHAVFTLLNGSRRDDFHVVQTAPDSIFIKMNTYDAALVAKIESDGRITGEYRSLVPNFRGNALPFVAEYGQAYRFEESKTTAPAAYNISGKWDLTIYSKEPTPNRIGLLKQEGNKLTGVIMSVVGDSRELEGVVHGDEFELSGFTGPSPIYIKGKINDDKSLTGELSLGIYNNIKFDGAKNAAAELPDPYKLTFLKEGYKKLDFTLPDLNGKPVSLSDEKYKGKVVIVEIIGTWCPNCTDQTSFLSPWFNKNKDRGVEAIAIGFEQKDDLEYAKYTLGKLKEKYNIQYDILFGGIADKKVASEKLPALNRMMAFPTTIIIDRKGEVRQIHTGYTGEVTGQYYKDYVAKWNKDLDELIAEK
ncbi:Peroxiredoxin [Chitinophaga terrae (ex Kim and Jung 2007)]|uniref:Peroxiredoxin n=1 Tax=Chitinophaga terrae (ex Kim and Jung 2007) TaxID=408074 RepID=A0A1H4FMG5_9BACT|nr:TlpA disulfide reductase family protein [Chitinophaga terrae (ex Kim and Jung 2007)]MDQ0108742.1 peroxiredoxin [Chitinophaga terrae (ex Kim and Jung 2007)]SEA98020.1 Peroxiredoxin [Chitinophaga terrae (ex Kim and Jung 2007)]